MAKAQKRDHDAFAEDDAAHSQEENHPLTHKPASRSCRGCYERKVRCDRADPCANCTRNGIACVYPSKDKDAARRTTLLQGICDRLGRLESLLQAHLPPSGSGKAALTGKDQLADPVGISSVSKAKASRDRIPNISEHTSPATWQLLLEDEPLARSMQDQNAGSPAPKVRESEAPLINSRSAVPSKQLRGSALHPTRPHSEPYQASHQLDSVIELCPEPKLALHLWETYVKSVDPMIKILHIPTIQSTAISTILQPKSAPSSTLALMFSIYFAAATALCYDEGASIGDVDVDKAALLTRFKKGLDRLLLTTDVMSQPSLTALQALAIYATCLRVHDVGRGVWILNGLAIRLAQSMGLDRDPTSFALSPFETEMRLRLWWHLCILDSRAPEDQAFQPTVDMANRHLRLPLNVKDNQLYPEMTALPLESTSWTEMTFFLVSTDSCRILFPILDVQERNNSDTLSEISRKRTLLRDRTQHILEKYGMHSGSRSRHRMFRIAEQHSKTARLKMEFMLQLRQEIATEKSNKRRTKTMPDVLKPSFKLACETLESSFTLWKDDLTANFKWFFRMYTQWYALAYVLRCLCSCPSGFETDRAWILVEELLPQRTGFGGHPTQDHEVSGPTSIWNCLNMLHSRAVALRDQARPSSNGSESDNRAKRTEPDQTAPSTDGAEHVTQSLVALIAHEHGSLRTEDLGQIPTDFLDDDSLPFLDISMPDLPFLPDSDWDAVMKGWLDESSQS